MLAVDAQLRHVAGVGLKKWVVARNTEVPASSWPTKTVAVGQGPDSWSATNWLLASERVNAFVITDAAFRTWNDAKPRCKR